MLEIRCTHSNGTGECHRFLFTLEGGFIVIRCPLCKSEQRIALAQLVAANVAEALDLQRAMGGESERLMW
mgnify:FL=1